MEKEPQPNYYDEYEIDLREYIMLLWDHKFFIGGIVVLAIIISFLYSSFLVEPVYESEADILAPNFTLLDQSRISKKEYISFLTSDTVIDNVKNMINQSETDEQLTTQNLLDSLDYKLNEENDQIKFSFQFNNREQTRKILAEWLSSFVNRVHKYIKNRNDSYYTHIEDKANNDYNDYKLWLDKKTDFFSENNLTLAAKDLAKKENKIVDLSAKIIDLEDKITSSKKELTYIDSRLEKTDLYLIRKNLINQESLQKLKAINQNQKLINLLNTEEEFLNPEYQKLINKSIDLSTNLIYMEDNLANYKNSKAKLEKESEKLQKSISSLKRERTIVEDKLENKKSNYKTSNKKVSSLDQDIVENDYQITILSAPKTPENKVSPNLKLNMAIAAVLGLMLAVFIVFFKEFMKEE
ncbi:MAG: GumC family protein [Bacillota bacterium]